MKVSNRPRLVGAWIVLLALIPPIARASDSELDSLVAEALENAPALIAARDRSEAAKRVPIQVSTLPDPQIMFQHFTVGSPKPFAGYEPSDFYYSGFGVTQEIPGPGKLRLRKMEAEKDAAYAASQYESARRTTVQRVRELYYELFYHHQTLTILDRNEAELHDIAEIAGTRYRVGEGLQQDLIKAQLATTSIQKEHAMHHEEEDQEQAELKSLLGRNPDSANIVIGAVSLTLLKVSSQELPSLVEQRSPEIGGNRIMEQRSNDALQLAKHDYWPDFTVGYQYEATGPGLRDYYMLTLGAKVPLYFWRKQKPAVEQAALESDAARQDARAAELQARSSAESSLVAVRTTERILSVYADGLIPQAETSKASALSAYRTGKVDFQTLLSAVIDLQNLHEEYYRALADHEIAVAKLQQTIGEQK